MALAARLARRHRWSPPRACDYCGRSLAGRRRDARLCSPLCHSMERYRARRAMASPAHKACVECGAEFETWRPRLQKYCGAPCRGKAKRRRDPWLAIDGYPVRLRTLPAPWRKIAELAHETRVVMKETR